jgi:hypothetical protein
MKRTFFAIISTIIMVAAGSTGIFALANAQQPTGQSSSPAIFSANEVLSQLPPVPSFVGTGAYESINYGPWFKISVNESSGYLNSTLTGDTEGGGTYGVSGVDSQYYVQVSEAAVIVNFDLFSGEKDSKNGHGDSWSIQLNEPFFLGGNNQVDWVQFVYQNNIYSGIPFYYYSEADIQEWDLSTSPYTWNAYSVSVPTQVLSTSTTFDVTGLTNNGNLEEYFTEDTNGKVYSYYIQTPDKYDLTHHWNAASGTILGVDQGSTANFVSPTIEETNVTVYPVDPPSYYLDRTTAEENNLTLDGSNTGVVIDQSYTHTTSSN